MQAVKGGSNSRFVQRQTDVSLEKWFLTTIKPEDPKQTQVHDHFVNLCQNTVYHCSRHRSSCLRFVPQVNQLVRKMPDSSTLDVGLSSSATLSLQLSAFTLSAGIVKSAWVSLFAGIFHPWEKLFERNHIDWWNKTKLKAAECSAQALLVHRINIKEYLTAFIKASEWHSHLGPLAQHISECASCFLKLIF